MLTFLSGLVRRPRIPDEQRMRASIKRDNDRKLNPEQNPDMYFKRPERIWMRENVARREDPGG